MKLDKKGVTLIESLFAFMLYVNVIILLLSLYNQMLLNSENLDEKLQKIENKEVILLEKDTLTDIIEMVLR